MDLLRVSSVQDIGLVLRQHRRARGITQAALAARIGVSRQWLSAVERGKARAEVGLVLRALRLLGVTLFANAPVPADARALAAPEDAPALAPSRDTPVVGASLLDAVLARARREPASS
ncbi:MAG: helix-turn-helix transcriptional regulator [Polyangiales bacterium]